MRRAAEMVTMKKTVMLVILAIVLGVAISFLRKPDGRNDQPTADATNRVANCVIELNGKRNVPPLFSQGEQIDIRGEMDIVDPPDDLLPTYVAFLVALDHPKAKDVIADSGFLQVTMRESRSVFNGRLKAPRRAGSYELRVFFQDSRAELQAMDPIRLFYRIGVTVK